MVVHSLKLKVSIEFLPNEFYHVQFQYQDDSSVLSIDQVPVLTFVIYDLPVQFFELML